MLFLPEVKIAYLYPKPIPMNWGETKLTQICKQEMGHDPADGGVFLFYNAKLDKLKVFFNTGSQELIKWLPKGAFMVPVKTKDEKFIQIEGSKLKKLFKSA